MQAQSILHKEDFYPFSTFDDLEGLKLIQPKQNRISLTNSDIL